MLARERGCSKLPVDGSGSAVDHHDRRDVAETENKVSIGHLGDPVSNGPHIAIVLDGRDGVFLRVQMLPAPPLPNHLAIDRHLDKIRGIHLAIVVLGTQPATSDLGNNLSRKRLLTDEKDVSVP